MAIITLLTDFGTRDVYAGVMKGVILSIAADTQIVDLTHDVAPQDVVEGAFLLATAWRHFPDGTVHVAVVDPGVGTPRRALAASGGGEFLVGPDNGVLMWALQGVDGAEFYAINESRVTRGEISATFHGRDVFAPAAARIAAGAKPAEIGERIEDPIALPIPQPEIASDRITCEVVHIDRFGNAITSLHRHNFRPESDYAIEAGGHHIAGVARTYGDVERGDALALFGSSGHLEIAVRDGDAAATLGLARGSRVVVRSRPQR